MWWKYRRVTISGLRKERLIPAPQGWVNIYLLRSIVMVSSGEVRRSNMIGASGGMATTSGVVLAAPAEAVVVVVVV